jgi:hypothetical protein
MDSVINVQIYKIDNEKLKLFFTCNPHFVPPLFSDKWHHEKGGAIRHCAMGNVDRSYF